MVFALSFFFFYFVFTFLHFFLVLIHLSLHFVFVLFLFSSPKTWTEPETPNPAPHFRWTLPLDPPSGEPPSAGQPSAGQPSAGPPKISLFFFPPPATIFILLSLSWGPFVEFCWCFWRPEPWNVHIWALGLSCETPAAPPERAAGACTRTTRELQTCTFQGPGASNTTKIPRKDPKRGKEVRKLWRRREKKREILGPPPFGAPPFGAPPFWAPHFWAPPFGAPLFLGWASTFWAPPFEGPTLCRPKIQHPKIGRNRIGRSRNWPKSKLAELEKKSWPKSKLAEVDHPHDSRRFDIVIDDSS